MAIVLLLLLLIRYKPKACCCYCCHVVTTIRIKLENDWTLIVLAVFCATGMSLQYRQNWTCWLKACLNYWPNVHWQYQWTDELYSIPFVSFQIYLHIFKQCSKICIPIFSHIVSKKKRNQYPEKYQSQFECDEASVTDMISCTIFIL